MRLASLPICNKVWENWIETQNFYNIGRVSWYLSCSVHQWCLKTAKDIGSVCSPFIFLNVVTQYSMSADLGKLGQRPTQIGLRMGVLGRGHWNWNLPDQSLAVGLQSSVCGEDWDDEYKSSCMWNLVIEDKIEPPGSQSKEGDNGLISFPWPVLRLSLVLEPCIQEWHFQRDLC